MSEVGRIVSASKWRNRILFSSILILLMIAFVADVAIGSVNIPFAELTKILFGKTSGHESWNTIVFDFRLPRAITAVLAGAALAVSGLQMQSLFRNPIAGPYLLGVSSGASLGVALLILATGSLTFFKDFIGNEGWGMIIAAITGSSLVLLLMLFISTRVNDITTILIIGMMFGSVVSAIVGILEYYSDNDSLKAFTIWSFGSLSGVVWKQLHVLIPSLIIGFVVAFIMIKPLNLLLLGENYAKSTGLNLMRTRILLIISTGILAGGITAFCGPIGFIGTAVPHINRIIFKTTDHRLLVPASLISGALLVLICDIVAQLPKDQVSLPINAITALIGAPIVIWIILSRRGAKSFF